MSYETKAAEAGKVFFAGFVRIIDIPAAYAEIVYWGETGRGKEFKDLKLPPLTVSTYLIGKLARAPPREHIQSQKFYYLFGMLGVASGILLSVATMGIPLVATTLADSTYNAVRLGKLSLKGKGGQGPPEGLETLVAGEKSEPSIEGRTQLA